MTRWQRMQEIAQLKADAGMPVFVHSAGGSFILPPSKQAVDAALKKLEVSGC